MYWMGPATDQGAHHVADLADGGVQGHRVHHVFAGYEVGREREPGGHLHRHQPAQDEDNGVNVPHLRQSGQRQDREGEGDDRVAEYAKDQEQLAVNAVGEYPAHEGEEQVGNAKEADRQPQRSLGAGEVQDQVADTEELDPLAEGLDPDIQKEPPEIPVAQSGKRAQPTRGGD